ncbi:threonyl-carbamoyl synthesis 6 [Musca autumnalis]|uniref:threonyl-carbamoyl synthesis 6 n=1 Tax=Musca autumnalis TaxID=221902 RepID=UPI003CF94DE2
MPLEDASVKTGEKSTEATLKIPFESASHAEIAYRVLRVDEEPRRNFVKKTISLKEDTVEVHFTADQVKNLRTAITSFFENLILCKETIKNFNLEENAGTFASSNTA